MDAGGRTMKARLLLMITLASPAQAEPCGATPVRVEVAATLKRATEDRPIHFSFATRAPGVDMPGFLADEHPQEMTIILQYEFDRLIVRDDRLEVGLWFNRRYARLVVPYSAITGVWDPTGQICGSD
jgi:hypothetical protein